MKSGTLNDMVNVIKKDFDNNVQPVLSGVKNATLGFLEGLYTPFLMSTGYRRYINTESSGRFVVQGVIATFMGAGIAIGGILGVYEGRWKETLLGLGAIAATNVVDYFANVYKRSKRHG